ncbi:metallophosphoesterase family protein [Neorhodopirellula pilleata]|uniref:Calcineurin-like phosphoesterase n=1 Tax=Neorhodopirellula pilleata TaxID=2714738 RepID=A0A5C6AA79_9BACT|nr:metallophosphoesterase [Neorhodopirellula pilleata]TWT96469.1 Calcineurin-like phosphoesterase [Neorhodopirellula pilleata]
MPRNRADPPHRVSLRRHDPSQPIDESPENDSSYRLAWITDPHFDHAKLDTWRRWADSLHEHRPSAIVLTGDLSEGDDVAYQLRCLAETFEIPIYFVLGNHDFYGKSIAQTRRDLIDLTREVDNLFYLTDTGIVIPRDGFAIVGEDGWGDATQGDYAGSVVSLNDFALIEDFVNAAPHDWQAMLQREGNEAAARLTQKLSRLADDVKHVLIATHVPPYREACWYEGKTTNDDWAPFFVCGAIGDALTEIAKSNPSRHFTVLCGHTHHDGDAEILPNLHVHTGYSRYGTIDIESIIRITEQGFQVPRSTGAKKATET